MSGHAFHFGLLEEKILDVAVNNRIKLAASLRLTATAYSNVTENVEISIQYVKITYGMKIIIE